MGEQGERAETPSGIPGTKVIYNFTIPKKRQKKLRFFSEAEFLEVGWLLIRSEPWLTTHLAVVLLAIDGAAGLVFILANVLALVARYHAGGLGHALVLADVGFTAVEARGFGAVELARLHPLANTNLLVVLAGRDAGRSRLGRGRMGNATKTERGNGGEQGVFHRFMENKEGRNSGWRLRGRRGLTGPQKGQATIRVGPEKNVALLSNRRDHCAVDGPSF
jgi:hypothetical protein